MTDKHLQNSVKKVQQNIVRLLHPDTATPELQQYNMWLSSQSGKELRPTMLYSAAGMSNDATSKKELLHAATAIELFHRSSLIHDDIIDVSPIRHNTPSCWKRFGTENALLLGDWMIAEANEQLSKVASQQARVSISRAFKKMCKGQLLQMHLRGTSVTISQYLKIISWKTAALFEASAEAGGLLSNKRNYASLRRAGLHFGTAFQLLDDMEDLLGDTKKSGKPLGQDIREKEQTLPLILLAKEHSIQNKSVPTIIGLFKKSKARVECKKIIERYITKAGKQAGHINNLLIELKRKNSIL